MFIGHFFSTVLCLFQHFPVSVRHFYLLQLTIPKTFAQTSGEMRTPSFALLAKRLSCSTVEREFSTSMPKLGDRMTAGAHFNTGGASALYFKAEFRDPYEYPITPLL